MPNDKAVNKPENNEINNKHGNKKLHDDPFYKAAKASTCAATAGFFAYFTGGSPTVYGVADKICDTISDAIAEPAHKMVHGKTYEEMNGKPPKP